MFYIIILDFVINIVDDIVVDLCIVRVFRFQFLNETFVLVNRSHRIKTSSRSNLSVPVAMSRRYHLDNISLACRSHLHSRARAATVGVNVWTYMSERILSTQRKLYTNYHVILLYIYFSNDRVCLVTVLFA